MGDGDRCDFCDRHWSNCPDRSVRSCDCAGARAARGDIVARCACGKTFTFDQWTALDLVGIQDDGIDTLIELRNCPCGSTRARRCDMAGALRLLNETAKKLRTALARLCDIERATSGLSAELEELDRDALPLGVTRNVIEAGVRAVELERERCAKLAVSSAIGVPEAWSPRDVGNFIAEQILKVP